MPTKFDHGLRQTILVSILYPLGPAALILMPLIVGGVIDDYGFTEQQAGTIASIETFGMVCGILLSAFWVRKYSWTRSLMFGLLAYAALNIISASFSSFIILISIRALIGLIAGSIFAIACAAMGDNREPDRAFGIGQGIQGVMMAAIFASAPMFMEGRDVGIVFYVLAGLAVSMIIILPRFPDTGIEHKVASEDIEKSYVHLIWLGLAGGICYYISIFGFWAFVERIGLNAGMEADEINYALSVSLIAAIIGGFVAAIVSNKLGRTLPLVVTLIGQLIALFMLIGEFSVTMYVIATCLYQFLYIVATCYLLGVIAVLDHSGKYVVMMNGFLGIGASIGPSLAAALITDDGYQGINYMAMTGIVACISIFLFIIYRTRHLADATKA
jgi:predicted MFS family arabinose efflux permease